MVIPSDALTGRRDATVVERADAVAGVDERRGLVQIPHPSRASGPHDEHH